MRRRWVINWTALKAMLGVWTVVGIVTLFIVSVADKRGEGRPASWSHTPLHWLVPLWLAPFAVVVVVFAVISLPDAIRWAWVNRPLRREWESVEDLRERHKRVEGEH